MPCHDCAKPHHLPPAGDEFRELDGRLVGLATGGQQHDFWQLRHQFGQSLGEIDHRPAQHRGKQVVEPPNAVAYRCDNLGMRMAEHRAHLARGKVQYTPASIIVEKRTLRPNRHEIDELAPIF
jgi:hypothetical protein